jgi:type VI secretion system secreted protein VgrG
MLARSTVESGDERVSSISLIEPSSAPFELRAGAYESPALSVVSLRGREAISEPFSFEITIAASTDVDDSTIEADLLGVPACLVMQAGASAPRFVRGVVAAVAAQSAVHGRRAVYRLRMVPALWLLKKRTTSRIFQEKTVPEIVAAVLDEAGVAYALHLLGKYRPRTYCVQHRETDFAFVERLLAEEGIFYTFDHGDADAESEVVSLSDSAHLYPAIAGDPELAYRPHEGAAGLALEEHHVQRFELRRSLRPTSVLRRGYDFRRPALALTAEAKLEALDGGEPVRGEIYEHHEEDEEPNVRQEAVNAELGQHRAGVELALGSSGCRRLVTGARFKLCDHDLGRLDAEYVVTSALHEGRSPETATQGEPVYANTFECVPATIPARPPRPTRTLQQVTETALVVGPEGQEIYTDEYGRVKVQFHWDREGRRDERSSCWIRVAQAWAGSGWGFEFIPRIGMEVIVTFLGGDVDRPLITGCVPNAINRPPFLLPENKTQSGIRTQSTPGGGGFNELSFEDQKGAEVLKLRAERNHVECVGLDQTVSVGNDQSIRVKNDRILEVQQNQSSNVLGDRSEHVGKNATLAIDGNSITTVSQGATNSVAGALTQTAGGRSTVTLGEHHVLKVAGDYMVIVGESDDDGKGSASVFAHRAYSIASNTSIRLAAKAGVEISCGDSSISLSPDGIKIKSKSLILEGGSAVSIIGKGPALHLTDDVEIVAKAVRILTERSRALFDTSVRLNGDQVKLNCDDGAAPPDSADGAPKEETVPFEVKVSDEDFKPYAGKHYALVVGSKRFEGTVGIDGSVKQTISKDATIADLTVWESDYPTGPRRHWALVVATSLPPLSTIQGVELRLDNLGYHPGKSDGETMSTATTKALVEFQKDHNLLANGALDQATLGYLAERHGN